MAKYKKVSSSPLVLLIPLVVAIAVVITAAIISNKQTYTRSKASFDPEQACINACNDAPRGVKDRAACALDCPAVADGTMSCNTFCRQNVSLKNANQAAQKECRARCNTWVGNPCDANGAVCKLAKGRNGGLAESQCATACNSVKDEDATCDETMTQASLSAVFSQLVPQVRQSCKKYFE